MDANVTGGDRGGMAWPTMRAKGATRVGEAGSRPSLRSSCSGLILSLIDATSDPRVALKISRRALSAELCRLAAAKRVPLTAEAIQGRQAGQAPHVGTRP